MYPSTTDHQKGLAFAGPFSLWRSSYVALAKVGGGMGGMGGMPGMM